MLKKKEGYDKLSLLPFPNLATERGCNYGLSLYIFDVRRSKRSRLLRLQVA